MFPPSFLVCYVSHICHCTSMLYDLSLCFFFHDPSTPEIYTYLHTLSLHDALPISALARHIHLVGRPDGYLVLAPSRWIPPAGGPGDCHHCCTSSPRRDP